MQPITVIGAGPAGSAAAIAARQEGASVHQYDPSAFPQHRVCGEFLSPALPQVLEELGVWGDFQACQPASIRWLQMHIGRRAFRSRLPETAYGLSRFRYDELLRKRALALGTVQHRERGPENAKPLVIATGRQATATRGTRLFGFKAHFDGPAEDAVELFFFHGGYVGLNSIEGGMTNVCGLAPETMLKAHDFVVDSLLAQSSAICERLGPLRRGFDWKLTGPLVFGNRFKEHPVERVYRAGDALQFVDPFTGSGLLAATYAGKLAGLAASRGEPAANYQARCAGSLKGAFGFSAGLRWAAGKTWAGELLRLVPASLLFHFTRPKVAVGP